MTSPYWFTFAIVSVVLIALGIPMVLRKVPPNPLYGLRVPATFKDDEVWYDANAASGRDMIILGGWALAFGLLPPWLGWSGEAHAMSWACSLAAGALISAVIGWRRANRMLDERKASGHTTR